MVYFNLLTLIFLVEFILCDFGNENKRLLLNDPDVVGARLANLERQNQLQTQLLNQMNATSQAEYADLKAKYMTLLSKTFQMESRIQHQDQLISENKDHGSTYVRWGRTQCEGTNTELVYSGYAAGQRHEHITYSSRFGGPANTLCLPKDPELSNISFTSSWSLLYGAEYEKNEFAPDSGDNDVPCAVCRNNHASSSIMIPGRHFCYSGWMQEYNGILASGHTGSSASSYICMDKNPEYISSGEKKMKTPTCFLLSV
ncbi:unnamed protein product [Mytilus edulis]|uniref:Uncharacterized protein n=1 Tax=Mytilus edulis TaxID=6550 RepID=A0A8S3QXF0_MYTED|nr:unnamed protein product [Mytilus edulis]